ncbi:MAG TPA: hybrid sensor histidine kinase/response regulator [Polyangiaceae bacterium]|jgi:signal transduction histidine kinase|nr:hybrid sensor histidine kinase/response regulator [Polyangiaceae bacterium]
MANLRLLRVPVVTLALALLAYGVEIFVVNGRCRAPNLGTASSVIEVGAELLAVLYLLRAPVDGASAPGRKAFRFGMGALCAADFFYWVFLYYVNGSHLADPNINPNHCLSPQSSISEHDPLVVLSTACVYGVAYVSLAAAMMKSWKGRKLRHLKSPASFVVIAGAVTLGVLAIALPMYRNVQESSEPFYHVGQSLAVITGCGLLIVSGITFLSASSQFLTSFAAASGTLILSDWCMRVEQFLRAGEHVEFGYYEIFWLGSVVAMVASCVDGVPDELVPPFDSSRLVSTVKLSLMAALAVPVASTVVATQVSVGQTGSIQQLRLVLVGCAFSIFVTGTLSTYLASQFTKFATRLDDPDTKASEFSGELREWFDEFVKIREERKKRQEAERVATAKRRLAHDIRAPISALAALIVYPGAEKTIAGNLPVARSAVERVMDMANAMLRETAEDGGTDTEVLATLMDSMVSQKRIEFRSSSGVTIESRTSDHPDVCAVVNASFLYRVLSNLINNAVEALGGSGRVIVELAADDATVKIFVQDNGSGVARENLDRIRTGLSTKRDGHGLGLSTAIQIIESWNGSLDIHSEGEGKGTTVTVTLPRAPMPSWFAPKLEIPSKASVLIVDDEPSVRETWQAFLRLDAPNDADISDVGTVTELEEWYVSRRSQRVLLLVDYELGEGPSGVDTVLRLGAARDSIIVTSHFQDADLRARCTQHQLRMIPKTALGSVPIIWA